uniref:Putative tick cistatins 1 n=1 Tax=Ixodes ricinus TaxID=34613 RepID=V5IBS5_IXORI
MARLLTLVIFLSGVACIAAGIPGGYSRKTDHQTNPKYLELAHFATSTWSAGQANKAYYDTVEEVLEAQTQVVAGINYKLTLKVAESVCEIASQYTKEACTPKPDAVRKTCTTVIYEKVWENKKSVSSFSCQEAV